MTAQYAPEDINYGSEAAFVESVTLGGTQQGTTDTAVLNFITITNTSLDAYTVTAEAAATTTGTVVTVLQPGVYVASLMTAIGAGGSAAISLGATAAPFNTTPVAIGGNDGLISLADNVTANQSVLSQTATFRITPAMLDGTQNALRFMGEVGATFIATQVKMRVDRILAAG